MKKHTGTLPLVAALCAVFATPALSLDIRPEDQGRLGLYHESLGLALGQALNGGDPEDVRLLTHALRGQAAPADEATLEGEWACRTIKMGKVAPLIVYQPFNCTVTRDSDGTLRLTKDGGSQLKAGRIQSIGGQLIYLGTSYVDGTEPVAYDDLPQQTILDENPEQILPDVAVVEQPGPDHVRLMFPSPWLESDFDILDMVR